MNGVTIPSVPITTLAGIASLTDLLPEMPLPTPLPQTLTNKSLLFHPRVAEEATILLSNRDETLVPQLLLSLSQTSSDNIELKDHHLKIDQPHETEENTPELLKAILQLNPHVFKGPQYNSPRNWPQNTQLMNANQSPANYGKYSPSYSNSSGSRQTPQGSPAHPASARTVLPPPTTNLSHTQHQRMPMTPQNHADVSQMSPFAVPSPSPRATVITEQTRTTPQHIQDDVNCINTITNINPHQNIYSPAHIGSQSPAMMQCSPMQSHQQQIHPQQQQQQHQQQIQNHPHHNMSGLTTPQHSIHHIASPMVDGSNMPNQQMNINMNMQQSLFDPIMTQPMHHSMNNTQNLDLEPVVMLNRLSAADQALMQQSLAAFTEKSPNLAAKMGLTSQVPIKSESDSEDDYDRAFKTRGKDRQKKKPETPRKRKKMTIDDDTDDDDDGDNDDKKDGDILLSPIKPKIRKIEKKLIPVLAKLSVDELMETNTYQRFNATIDTIFENTEDDTTIIELDEDGDVPQEMLIPKYQLQDLCREAAKLKSLRAMESIPSDRLVRLLNILEKNIRDGARVSPLADPDDDVDETRLWMQLAMERVQRAVDASLIALNIMTSQNMKKIIYLEDVIDRIVLFMKFQLNNTIYPSFDPVYRIDSKNKTENYNTSGGRKKRGQVKEVREKSILEVYSKMHELVSLLAELLNIQILTDTTVLHASTMGVAPFFVESVSELQLSSLKLVTVIFTKYEKHRKLLLEDILASIARLPSSKRSLRSYRLNSEDHIQMLTAMVLQLIQCVVTLPDSVTKQSDNKINNNNNNNIIDNDNDNNKKNNSNIINNNTTTNSTSTTNNKKSTNVDLDVLIINKYDTATRIAANFLSVFLNKCSSKGSDIDYRPLFENFVQDLLATVNKPEWPAAELLLSLLGSLLVGHFSNKSSDMSLRVASIEYLGVVAARLRKDAVNSQCKLSTIDQIVKDIKTEQQKDIDYEQTKNINGLSNDDERTMFLQRVLLDHLAVNSTKDSPLSYARHFYIAQWYRDCTIEKNRVGQTKNNTPIKKPQTHNSKKKIINKKRNNKQHIIDSDNEDDNDDDDDDDSDIETINQDENDNNEQKYSEVYRLIEEKKKFIISSIRPCSSTTKPDILQTYIDYSSAELISQYLASKRSFSQSFDTYLKQIVRVLTESSIAIRTKAMKCLTMIVEADPSVLARADMKLGVHNSFLDHSTSVREAAIDLVGKFVLSRPELIDNYYEMLLARILDTGVSVRKRVIKILKDICIECPTFSKVPEICGKMIRRINDEEGIRKLVMEVFQNMWFTPVTDKPTLDTSALLRKVMNITDVVAQNKDLGLEWFEQLLVSLFKPKEDKDDRTKIQTEPPKALLTACKQIVDCLIENILRLEELNLDDNKLDSGKKGASQRLVACLTTLYLFAKIRPQLLVNHAITLQPYLSLRCQTQGDYQIISSVAHTLELVVPLMEHPSETFLAQLEEDSVKLILQHDKSVVASCLSCLGSIVNNVTRNFKLIRDCFNEYYGCLTLYKDWYEKDTRNPMLLRKRPLFRRALFTVGLLLRHFNFTDPEVIKDLPDNIKDQVFETLSYFVQLDNDDIRQHTLTAIGSLCIRHYEFMMMPELKELYHYLLTSDNALVTMKTQVLNNIEMYLQEEEKRMIKQDQEWAKLSKQENLKEMGDVSSGMASTVIQLYLKEILESFLHTNINVRHSALKVIQLILAQGLVHPVQIVPYLICMSTDIEKMVSHSADKQLQEIEKKYPGFIHMKSQFGIKLSYRLQKILQNDIIVRGMKTKDGEIPSALNGFLYTILRNTKQQRRAIVLSFLKQFDETAKSSLSQMLFLADNLAYFSYQVQDEPLFIIHHIDIIISMSGMNLLQSFKEALLPKPGQDNQINQQLQQPQPQLQPQLQQQQQPPQLQEQLLINQQDQQQQQQQLVQPMIYGPDGQQQIPAQINPATIDDEEEDEEDDEAILARLPEDTTLLRQYITASQGFLLLLTLRQHLKEVYGFSDAKISQYSPSESAKVYEKAVTRKSTMLFLPKATLVKLKEDLNATEQLDEQGRKKLVAEYLDFRQLMLKFDPEDPEEDNADNNITNSTLSPIKNQQQNQTNMDISPIASNNTTDTNRITTTTNDNNLQFSNINSNMPPPTVTPRVPKLTIHTDTNKEHRKHRTHKTEKVKKHKKKKRRRISDSSDSGGDDCSDPDFMV
ncbi:hypothetical protein HCN44_005832 [Aphidius gifuensis]|uniref:Nipped-B protein n=1 Tax=Aphidius gifuensis TaxID=684658 RepID=A0A834XVU7_APHGI|nr:hypothetical protein HCN44_005832 [Aphidius gifuensis]